MGKLVARAKDLPLKEFYRQYQKLLMESLKLNVTPKKNANVLQHMMGYFKEQVSADEKTELLELIEAYRKGYIPLIVPITLIQHYVRKQDQPYLKQQVYLSPHPFWRIECEAASGSTSAHRRSSRCSRRTVRPGARAR